MVYTAAPAAYALFKAKFALNPRRLQLDPDRDNERAHQVNAKKVAEIPTFFFSFRR